MLSVVNMTFDIREFESNRRDEMNRSGGMSAFGSVLGK